jgi:hypothetical protein
VITNKKVHFLFNLSLISPTEQIIKTELYLNKRYVKQKLVFNLHYFLYLTTQQANQTSSRKLKSSSSGFNHASTIIDLNNKRYSSGHQWSHFNIVDSLRSYTTVRNSKYNVLNTENRKQNIYYLSNFENSEEAAAESSQPDELVMIMEAFFGNRKVDKALYSDSINPYLMVYSNENEKSMKKFFQNRVPADFLQMISNKTEIERLNQVESQIDEEVNTSSDQIEASRSSTTFSTTSTTADLPLVTTTKSSGDRYDFYLNHKDKSIILIEEKTNQVDHKLWKSKFREAKKQMNVTEDELKFLYKSGIKKFKRNNKRHPSRKARQTENLFQKESDKIGDSDDEIHIRNDSDVSLLLSWDDSSWNSTNTSEKVELENEAEISRDACEIKPIVIDFSDLNFSDWILEPKSYQSNYCSGTCKFSANEVTLDFRIYYNN